MCDGNFNTTFNTLGVGDVVPAGLGDEELGSGDKLSSSKKKVSIKKAAKNVFSSNQTELPYIVFTKDKK